MINPENLRIGDLVMVSRDCAFSKGTMCAVTQIDPERVHEDKKGVVTLSYTDGTDDGPWGTWCCNIEGVPLTPEILEKNGFEVTYPGKYYNKQIGEHKRFLSRYLSTEYMDTEWEVSMNYDTLINYVTLCSVRYVHELQHVLWALGENAKLNI